MDVVYKMILKNNNIYFCKVGGQSYKISDEDRWSENLSDDELLKTRANYKISRFEIQSVVIDDWPAYRAKNLPDNGTVIIKYGNKSEKYIIHPVETALTVYHFFTGIQEINIQLIAKQRSSNSNPKIQTILIPVNKSIRFRAVYRLCNVLNTLAVTCGIWFLVFPKPYLIAFLANLLLPLVGYTIYLIKFDFVNFKERTYRKNPNVLIMIVFPTFILMLRAALSFRVFYTPLFWLIVVALAVIFAGAILCRTKEFRRRKWLLVVIPLFLFSYLYGVFTISNCFFDTSVPVCYTARIENKFAGKYISIDVSPWGPV
ncbi:MAG: hypothetical protein P4L75_04695 [Clostridia bacterium]|nr:hypothetical protein [Clostridia bacterium]